MKEVLITGAAKRLGRDLAIHLGKQGFFVWIHYNNSKQEAEEVLKLIHSSDGVGELIQGDISQYSQAKSIANKIKLKGSSLNLLINNVGKYSTGDITKFSIQNFESIINTNLLGSYYMIQELHPLFNNEGGNIINIGYTGIHSLAASKQTTAYSISKTGLYILNKSYAEALAEKNIRVNMISPGHLQNSIDLPKDIKTSIPLGRSGSSKDILDLKDRYGDTIFVIKDHHFYEGIQKYDMFFAGWDDNDSVVVIEKEHGDKNATSPNQIAYRNLWGRYNTIKTLAVNGGKFMFINRVVSMMDALLLAKKWNNKHDIILSLNVYPDLRNKSGVGGVKLSLKLK